MSYAVIETGGKQFRVTEGQTIRVPVLDADEGASVQFNTLLTGGGDAIQVGAPALDGFYVWGKVVEHGRAPKIIVFKKKRKKQYKKTHGHRQGFTAVLIESIGAPVDRGTVSGGGATAATEAAASETEQPGSEPADQGSAAAADDALVSAAAEPTAVNTQITDSVTGGSEDTAALEPEDSGDSQ